MSRDRESPFSAFTRAGCSCAALIGILGVFLICTGLSVLMCLGALAR